MPLRFKDAYIGDIPMGTLVYPSTCVRASGKSGNYYLENLLSFVDDIDIFPAVILSGCTETYTKILTPTGVHMVSKFSLVSCERSR